MPRIFVLSGDDIGRTYDFDGPVVLGRDGACDIVLRSPSVSRRHARLEPDEHGDWLLSDLGSSNGVSVGGVRAERAELAEGSVFRLGELELRFRARLEADAGAVPRPDPRPTAAVRSAARAVDEVELEGDWEVVPPDDPALAPAARSARPAPKRAASRGIAPRPAAGRAGLLGSDLAQYGALTRWTLYLLVLAVCAALGYGAFRLTLTLRAQTAEPVVTE